MRKVWTIRARALGGGADPFRPLLELSALAVLGEHLGLADDRGERVVELVAHAGEQRAQSGELLRLEQGVARAAELLLGALPVGHVDMDAVHRLGGAVAAVRRRAERIDPAQVAIRVDDAIFDLDRLFRKPVEIGRGELCPVVGMDSRAQRLVVDRVVRAERVDLARPVRIPDRSGDRIERPDADLRPVHRQLEPPPHQLELRIGLLAGGDVEMDAVDRLELAGFVANRGAERGDPAVAAVRLRHPELHRQRLVGILAVIRRGQLLPIVGMHVVPEVAGTGQVIVGQAEHVLRMVGEPDRALGRVERPDAELGALHRQLEPPPHQLELLLREFAVGDVEQDAVDRIRLALFVAIHGAEAVHPADLAVRPYDPILDAERLVGEAVGVESRPADPSRRGEHAS